MIVLVPQTQGLRPRDAPKLASVNTRTRSIGSSFRAPPRVIWCPESNAVFSPSPFFLLSCTKKCTVGIVKCFLHDSSRRVRHQIASVSILLSPSA